MIIKTKRKEKNTAPIVQWNFNLVMYTKLIKCSSILQHRVNPCLFLHILKKLFSSKATLNQKYFQISFNLPLSYSISEWLIVTSVVAIQYYKEERKRRIYKWGKLRRKNIEGRIALSPERCEDVEATLDGVSSWWCSEAWEALANVNVRVRVKVFSLFFNFILHQLFYGKRHLF